MALGAGRGLQDWEAREIRRLVGEQRRRRGLSPEDTEDLRQECLLHWIEVRERVALHPDGAAAAYMRRVIRGRIVDLFRRDNAVKRGRDSPTLSLDQAPPDSDASDEDHPSWVELIPDECSVDTSGTPPPNDLRLDVARALGGLTERQRRLCEPLGPEGLTAAEAARALGLARSTLYLELNKLRRHLAEFGLDDYLRG
ncbi:MAG: hypothetical protein RL562_1835 [Planctomycetota bacterium]